VNLVNAITNSMMISVSCIKFYTDIINKSIHEAALALQQSPSNHDEDENTNSWKIFPQ
jgi:hypothetical protein